MNTNQNIENTEKVDLIIDAAQKRFGAFGLMKTTMQEIASDLSMSKGILYYYFPDKEHLYKAVVEKEQNEFIKKFGKKLEKISDPEVMLTEYVEIRLSYFKTLINLNRLSFEASSNINNVLGDIWVEFRKKEVDIVKSILNKGIDQKVFKLSDVDETASIFVDLLKGLRMVELHKKRIFYIDEDEYKVLKKKMKIFTELFIKGLKY